MRRAGARKRINQSPSNKNELCEKKSMVHSVKCLRRPRTDNVFVSLFLNQRPHTVITQKEVQIKGAIASAACVDSP